LIACGAGGATPCSTIRALFHKRCKADVMCCSTRAPAGRGGAAVGVARPAVAGATAAPDGPAAAAAALPACDPSGASMTRAGRAERRRSCMQHQQQRATKDEPAELVASDPHCISHARFPLLRLSHPLRRWCCCSPCAMRTCPTTQGRTSAAAATSARSHLPHDSPNECDPDPESREAEPDCNDQRQRRRQSAEEATMRSVTLAPARLH
jgi:hypothetical protein